ncbi:MAG: type II toxin-antitoxin system ParD family antitoxin [Methylococcaceae bacterium]|nr:type II toxin-antitoxin system ParD family antitoxin [Methylococcaceae bacterium]
MNISLTAEFEQIIKNKVESGLYNNASEVVREALRFMQTNEELVYQIKLDKLKAKLAVAEHDMAENRYQTLDKEKIETLFDTIKQRAL